MLSHSELSGPSVANERTASATRIVPFRLLMYHGITFMAGSIYDAFQALKANLEISGLQAETVSTRQQNVRKVVESGLAVSDSFLTGSYKRNTMIAPLSEADIDIFMVLDSKYFYHYDKGKTGGQAGLLDLVKRTLRKTYTRTPDISRNGQAVTIRFDDFMVDVVPAFARQGGGYLIPNSITGNWIPTDPKKHVEVFSEANAAHNGDLVPLLKMIKAWNKNTGQHFRAFHLEVMALYILQNVRISDFPSGTRFFFDKAREKIKFQTPDPAAYTGDIGDYISSTAQIEDAVGRFQDAYDQALKAEDYARRGLITGAKQLWHNVFGDHFPTD